MPSCHETFPFTGVLEWVQLSFTVQSLKVWHSEWFWNYLGHIQQCWSEQSNKCEAVACEPPPDITQHESDSDLQKCLHSPKQWVCRTLLCNLSLCGKWKILVTLFFTEILIFLCYSTIHTLFPNNSVSLNPIEM